MNDIYQNKNNIHLFWSDLTVESRLFKESSFVIENNILKNVYALGISRNHHLPKTQNHKSGLKIYRIRMPITKFKKSFLGKYKLFRVIFIMLSLIKYGMYAILLTKKLNISHISIHNLQLLPLGVFLKLIFKLNLVYLPHELETEKSGLSSITRLIYRIVEKSTINFVNFTV